MSNTVYAAGAVLWRIEKGKLKVALVHRSRYNDWSFAKGKVDPGERLAQTAVREIREETGLKVRLGVKLSTSKYELPNGNAKEVHYWAARVTDKALRASTFKPDEEVASVDWVSPDKARSLFSYAFDKQLLDEVENLHKAGLLDTRPFIVLRHAKATPRADWNNGRNVDDGKRPLLPEGLQQAQALVPLLSAFGPKRVFTSPWFRCRATVAPYAAKRRVKIIERSVFSELGNFRGPQRTAKEMLSIIEEHKAALVCAHRPSLPTILGALATLGTAEQAQALMAAKAIKPAEFVVVHLTVGKKRRIAAVETYGLE
ncbi:MAG: NUDIX hydrolase [Actinomycetales bacterium]|nr:NUDIX hydrolase [Actinomycetales bacterium]